MPQPIVELPANAVLVHVGFHKTGTTALQSAFASVRPQLLEAGVLYPGDLRSHHRAAMAVTERTWGWSDRGGRAHRASYWEDVVAQTRAHPGRVVISSEALSLAKEPAIDRMVEELGSDRVHVVGTLRPFARLLPSSWQQYLKYGLGMPYGEWLENAFEAPPACPPSPNFWRRNDYSGVARRWAERIGADRVGMVLLDGSDRGALFRTFERMLGLPDGILVPDPAVGASNRSMTAGEAEMLRLVNARGARDWDWSLYQGGVRRGAVMRMVEARTPSRDEPGLVTPGWAVEKAQEYGRSCAEALAALEIRVSGDLDTLAAPMPASDIPDAMPVLPADAAAEAVLGAVLGTAEARPTAEEVKATVDAERERAERRGEQRAVAALATADVARLLQIRVRQAGARRLRRSKAAKGRTTGKAGGSRTAGS